MSCVLSIVPAGGKKAMLELADTADWKACLDVRAQQRLWGAVCALLLAFALLALVDGLQGMARSGSEVIELLPGDSVPLSGPLTIKNPVNNDLHARFTPPNSFLTYELEGFFAGYWFGNGMWRGHVRADASVRPGRYELQIAFRGAPASATQRYAVVVHEDGAHMRAAAPSFLRRIVGYNPFVLAAWGGGFALLAGLVPLYLGCRYIRLLAALGCGEVVRVQRETPEGVEEQTFRIWCQIYGLRAPAQGTACAVYDGQGRYLCKARAAEFRKGSLELTFPIVASPAENVGTPPNAVRTGCLVQLRPHQQPHSPPATGR